MSSYTRDRSKEQGRDFAWLTWIEEGEGRVAHYAPTSSEAPNRALCGESVPFWRSRVDEVDADPDPCGTCESERRERDL